MCVTVGQVSDHIGAKILYQAPPNGGDITMIADKGYDSDEYRIATRYDRNADLYMAAIAIAAMKMSLVHISSAAPAI